MKLCFSVTYDNIKIQQKARLHPFSEKNNGQYSEITGLFAKFKKRARWLRAKINNINIKYVLRYVLPFDLHLCLNKVKNVNVNLALTYNLGRNQRVSLLITLGRVRLM